MQADSRKAAEDFIEKVIAPRRAAPRSNPKQIKARTELARAELELAKRELAQSGLDPERLDKLAVDRSREHKKLADQGRRNAVEASAAAANRLKDLAPVILPIDPVDTIIDQVTFIRSFAGQGSVLDSNIAPSDNWARYRMESSDEWDGTGRLSFFTLWKNPLNQPTVVMARPNLVINAHLSCDADWNGVGSWFGFKSEARATVLARTTVWSMDSNISSIVHDEQVGAASARGGFFGDDNSASIEFNEVLSASGVAVPADAYILIEVELFTEWHAVSGSVVLDGEGGSHRVDVPQIILSEIRPPTPPPISITAGVDYATNPATVTLLFTGATGAFVDIYQDGVKLGDTENDGSWSWQYAPGTYRFRVCEKLSTTVCSTEVSVTVT
jgi:hypothetical protein